MGQTQSVLLGRERELLQLNSLVEGVRRGEPAFVLISGEPGIGKTRLLTELAEIATQSEFVTFSGRASEFETEVPFGLFVDALDAYLASLDSSARSSLAADRLGAVAAVFPSLGDLEAHVEFPVSASERFRFHRAVGELLDRLATRRSIALLFDDLQWADDASLELLSYLSRHPPREVLIATATRTEGGDATVAGLIRTLRATPEVISIGLQPLSYDNLTALVGVDNGEIYHLSGGNPLYALSLAIMSGEGSPLGSGYESGVPAVVAGTVASELGRLSPRERELAQAAAVAGDPFDIAVAAAAAGVEEDEVLDLFDALLINDLVRETGVPRRLQFRHPIVRSAVYGSGPASARIRSHRRVAEYLGQQGAPAGEIASHVEQYARPGDSTAVALLESAGLEARSTAPATATRWFAAALRLLPPGKVDERVEVLWLLGTSLTVAGRLNEAFAALEEGLVLAPADHERNLDLLFACASIERQLGHYEDARKRLSSAFESLPDPESPDALALSIALALNDFHGGDYLASKQWSERSGRLAARLSDELLETTSLATQAMASAMAGEVELAMSLHSQAKKKVDDLEDDQIAARLDALSSLAGAEIYLDLFEDAVRHSERCLTLARQTGQLSELPMTSVTLGTARWLTGDMERSAEVLEDAVEVARLVGNPAGLSWVLFNRAYAALEAGDVETALKLSEESLALTDHFEPGLISAYAGATNSMTLLELGEPQRALDRLLAFSGGENLSLIPGSWRPTYFELMTRCYLGVGDRAGAGNAARRARDESSDYRIPLPEVMANLADADIALADENWNQAVALALAAALQSSDLGLKPYEARSHAMAGAALTSSGRSEQAVEHFEKAADLYEEIGAFRYRDQVNSRLRALGRPAYRRSRSGSGALGLAALTGREMEVAELVRDRRTNREIADTLFLSTKTVETHIRNIFNKLGVDSRVDIARVLDQDREQAGVPPTP